MKTLIAFLLLLMGVTSINIEVQAQQGVGDPISNPYSTQPKGNNIISVSQYSQIKYNGYTINQLNSLVSNEEMLFEMLGQPQEVVNDPMTFDYIRYRYNGFVISYFIGAEKGGEEDYISSITITSRANFHVKVLNKTIRVGDSFEQMKQLFGSQLKIRMSMFTPEYLVGFNTTSNTFDDLAIYFDETTNKITRIKYYILP